MAAVCRGAHEAGGETTGVVSATLFPDREPNPYLTERVEAPDLLGRIEGLFRRAHAFVVLDGSVGTVTELLLAWNHRLLGDPRPLVLVGPRLRQLAGNLCASSGIGENELALLDFVPTPEEAVAVLDHRLG
jgi:hypothetical protein